ncbi:hypothetical protein QYE76_036111 [Lolium multiflorum]|uniref:Uncharacterized protein n=1 Tax=Lolium multiflorum TaxID=4521 RepID=A0AAD8VPV5_LOLMU|nr:hypothetical protein QYE76_036111 [Lolium multiflorum]
MAFAGVSLIADGKLMGTDGSSPTPTINAKAASGYHLLVVEGHSRTAAHHPLTCIRSRPFIIGGHRWCILYYPHGRSPDDAGFISLHLSSEHGVKRTNFEFSFVDETEKQEPAHIRAGRRVPIYGCYSAGYGRFVKRDALEKSKHLRDDSFTIRCDVVVAQEDVTSPCVEVPPSNMKRDFTDLLLTGEGADVVFRIDGDTFAAHRCVLAARSAVFKAMLFGPMKEGSAGTVVQIDDMDATVFKAMLVFIYGDSLPAEEGGDGDGVVLLQHLLEAADMYGIPRLSAMCEKRLCEHIGVSTAMSILALADHHGCHGLKEACYEFLSCPVNLRAVVAMDGFDHLCGSCPPLIKDLVIDMLQPAGA